MICYIQQRYNKTAIKTTEVFLYEHFDYKFKPENDTVFLGYPIWYGTMPLIMNTFLEKYDMSGKTIIPFSTAAGSGFGSSIADLKKLCPNSNILDGYTVSGTKAKDSKDYVEKWLKEINVGGNTK